MTVFSDRLALPVIVQPDGVLVHKLRLAMEGLQIPEKRASVLKTVLKQFGVPDTAYVIPQSNRSQLLRRPPDYTDFPYVYSVIARQLHLPLAFEGLNKSPDGKVKSRLDGTGQETAARKISSNPSKAYQVLHTPPYDKRTNFSAIEIQEYVEGFRNMPRWSNIPSLDIQRLLKAQPEAETLVLRALLKTMSEEPIGDSAFVSQDTLLVRMARALALFSERAVHESASEFDALRFTPRQIGAMPDLAGAFGILGKSYLPLFHKILNSYSSRVFSAKTASYHDYFQYHAAAMGLCRLGTDAAGALAKLNTMAQSDLLFLERHKGGIITLIMLKRLGANLENYWRQFEKAGWKRNNFDAFAAIEYDGGDCRQWSGGSFPLYGIFEKYPQLRAHWPNTAIREFRSF